MSERHDGGQTDIAMTHEDLLYATDRVNRQLLRGANKPGYKDTAEKAAAYLKAYYEEFPPRKPSAGKPTGMSFVINSLSDFVRVPADRIDACLDEFKEALSIARGMKELADKANSAGLLKVSSLIDRMVWKDDGKRDKTVSVKTTAKKKGEGA